MIAARRCEFRALVVVIVLIAKISDNACNGDSSNETNSSSEKSYVTLIPTYRTGIERLLQELLGSFPDNSSSESESSDRSSGSSEGLVGSIINSIIPQPVKNIINPIANATARGFGDILNLVEDKFHAIYPGTFWCGGGNIADSQEDVGIFYKSDKCCRAHDNCPENIEAGDSLGRLLNDGAFTRSACSCDQEFYECLKKADTLISTSIGSTYFNILRPQCFARDYPITGCAKRGKTRIVNRKCSEYEFDTSGDKILEWFDNPDY